MAAQRHHVSVMELLIKHGADINDTNKVFASNDVLVSTMLVVISSNQLSCSIIYRLENGFEVSMRFRLPMKRFN